MAKIKLPPTSQCSFPDVDYIDTNDVAWFVSRKHKIREVLIVTNPKSKALINAYAVFDEAVIDYQKDVHKFTIPIEEFIELRWHPQAVKWIKEYLQDQKKMQAQSKIKQQSFYKGENT